MKWKQVNVGIFGEMDVPDLSDEEKAFCQDTLNDRNLLARVYESFKPRSPGGCIGNFTYEESVKRNNGIQTLAKLAEKDVLVAQFLAQWRNGEIRTFEEMLVDLTVQLSVRSENLIKQLVNTLPSKSITIGDPQPHIREAKE